MLNEARQQVVQDIAELLGHASAEVPFHVWTHSTDPTLTIETPIGQLIWQVPVTREQWAAWSEEERYTHLNTIIQSRTWAGDQSGS